MTYGYNRKSAKISTKVWEDGTGMKATHVYRNLRRLEHRNIVTYTRHKGNKHIGIQKNYKKWKVVTDTRLCDQRTSQLVTNTRHSLPIISKKQLIKTHLHIIIITKLTLLYLIMVVSINLHWDTTLIVSERNIVVIVQQLTNI